MPSCARRGSSRRSRNVPATSDACSALHGLSDATPRTLGIDVPTLLEDHARASGISGQVTLERLARSVDLEAPALQRLLVAERAYQRILRGEHPRP